MISIGEVVTPAESEKWQLLTFALLTSTTNYNFIIWKIVHDDTKYIGYLCSWMTYTSVLPQTLTLLKTCLTEGT
jgi:hypothetical protein